MLKVLKKIEEQLENLENKSYPAGVQLPSAYILGKACIEMFEELQSEENNPDKVKDKFKDIVIFSIFHAEYENNALNTLQYDAKTIDKLNDIDDIQDLIKCCTEENNKTRLPLTNLLVSIYDKL